MNGAYQYFKRSAKDAMFAIPLNLSEAWQSPQYDTTFSLNRLIWLAFGVCSKFKLKFQIDIQNANPHRSFTLSIPAAARVLLTSTVGCVKKLLRVDIVAKWDLSIEHIVVHHYSDVIMGATFQITSLTDVYSAVYSGADQRKHQTSASLAFVRRIHRWLANSPHNGTVTRKMFPFDDVIMGAYIKAICSINQ